MSGGKIFQKPNGVVHYYDQITVGGYSFDASIAVLDKRGDPSAIHCGRIVVFEMTCEDELAAYYDDGQWYIVPEKPPFFEPFGEAAAMARDLLIQKWSNPEKIRNGNKIVHTDLF